MINSTDTILILHRIPYKKVRYAEVIDHELHRVIYVVTDHKHDIDIGIRKTIIHARLQQYVDDVICAVYSLDVKIDKVIALSEYSLTSAVLIRAALGLCDPGDVRLTYNARDKWLMKKAIENADLLTAQGAILESLEGKTLLNTHEKIVVKPIRGASSEDTFILDNGKISFTDNIRSTVNEFPESFIVEKFISGDIYHFDGLIYDGKVIFVIGSMYLGDCLNFTKGRPLASVQLNTTEQYHCWIIKCLNAVGICTGAFHLEGIMHNNEMYFLEVGNRSGGAGVVSCTKEATDINLLQEEVKMAIGYGNYHFPKPIFSNNVFGWFVIPKESFIDSTNTKKFKQDIPELFKIILKQDHEDISSVSYSEDHNPCTGMVCAISMEKASKAISRLLKRFSH